MKHHPDRNPEDHAAEGKFKEAKGSATKSSRMPRSARLTTTTVMPALKLRRAAGLAAGRASIPATLSAIFSVTCSATSSAPDAAAAHRCFAAPTRATNSSSNLNRRCSAIPSTSTSRRPGECDECSGHWLDPRTCRHLHDLPRRRAGCGCSRDSSRSPADVPALPGPRADRQRPPVPALPRPGPRAASRRRWPSKVPAGVDSGRLGSGSAATARPVAMAGRPATCMSRSAFGRSWIFERDGSHLSCELPITFKTAALGGSIEVPTLDGEVTIRVPPETQSGRVFRCARRASSRYAADRPATCSAAWCWRHRCTLPRTEGPCSCKFDESLQKDAKHHHPRGESWLDGVKRFLPVSGSDATWRSR